MLSFSFSLIYNFFCGDGDSLLRLVSINVYEINHLGPVVQRKEMINSNPRFNTTLKFNFIGQKTLKM